MAKPSGQQWLEQMGIDYDITPIKLKLQEAAAKLLTFYPDNNHMEDWQGAEKIAEVVPYELQALVDKVAVAGDPDSVTRRMKELEDLGVDHIYLYPAESWEWFIAKKVIRDSILRGVDPEFSCPSGAQPTDENTLPGLPL